ncbi:MAG: glutamate synthase large subunit [Verrucomicrobia bacterium]|jgi:glutamate synthase (NADPH/NADH) large chain/glutamate synthase (ferredoxin)|nr:glutamate synthase large subunit [Verrucomicrobiota bacterium]
MPRNLISHSTACPPAQGLYEPKQERDACGVGFIANLYGQASHAILDGALTGLKNLAHRGAIDADAVTGDGAGLLTEIPYDLYFERLRENGVSFPEDRKRFAVGMFFLTREDKNTRRREQEIVEEAVRAEGIELIAWRSVPVDNSCLGRKAESTRPEIAQAFLLAPEGMEETVFARHLLLTQKACTRGGLREDLRNFYVVSMSHRTVTYKGLLNAPQVRRFFDDLKSPAYKTAYAIFHQRFATNTFPDWSKAQPFRMLAHNGEINTIRGNRNNMRAREFSDDHGIWGDRYKDLFPMVQEEMSDSASFDNCLQLLTAAERPATTGVSIMMPAAWEENRDMPAPLRDFYKYHSVMLEPWDGPAAIVFSDGRYVGASLDRNGLRPARFKVWEDGTIVLASETGLIPHSGKVVRAGRLGPGRMIAVDLERHRLLEDDTIKSELAQDHDYTSWCANAILPMGKVSGKKPWSAESIVEDEEITSLRVAFGYDLDEENLLLKPMVQNGKEAIGSMGDDTPLAVLSRRPRLLYTYFKQLFAQVTNPAIDSLRERSVMSQKSFLGGRLSLFDNLVKEHHFVSLESPVLLDAEYKGLWSVPFLKETIATLDATFPVADGPDALRKRVQQLREEVNAQIRDKGTRLVILSDRNVNRERAPVPMLLATGAIHSELVRVGRRIHCDIVCESGEVRDVHQLACVVGFGANAVYPYLALDMIRKIISGRDLAAEEERIEMDLGQALGNYRKALDAGLLKILSKMGISTLFSYQGAKVFEAIGIGPEIIEECFEGTASPIGGIGYREVAMDVLHRHEEAFPMDHPAQLWSEGYLRVLKKGGEYHAWSSKVVSGMNTLNRKGGEFSRFKDFREASDFHLPVSVKDLLRLNYPADGGIPLEEVEPVEEIRRRFTTAGMSLGALSPEMHETLAIAMNGIGGKSNSGEGGEDPKRFHPYENGQNANSAIKQVASGRFGVTAEYLANAQEIEIKIAQGAKPGEGGQLMGWKVSPLIASLRFSVPGVTLISPPPHHDIYSIEDLAQLIFDLKQVNPRAKVCVKLVASSGVGTIAAGVAKAYADVILISGHEGGTGASPISSIKHAGSSWEIGLAEAHQVLMLNDLRSRVTLRTDGGMKTGRDIVVAALLGAEEFNFGTAALIAGGCAMFRVCHLNTCPVGVATQRDDLRAKFRGKPEYIVNYFNAVAQDVRLLMSRLGFRSMNEMVGRPQKLESLTDPRNPKTTTLDFSRLLHDPDPEGEAPRIHTRPRNDRFGNEGSLDDSILQEAKETVTHKTPPFRKTLKVTNVDRNIGTRLSGEIAYLHGNRSLQPGTLQLRLEGSAGQGLGAFLVQGIQLHLVGDANDYVGKGMNSGLIIAHPSWEVPYNWHENTLMGNTCLYGATGGMLLGAGQAGERFAVRNSGATAVVEGVGDHACEYMTGGTIVCLGETGRNFGAGMSGGTAFVYDPMNRLSANLNHEMVYLERLDDNEEIDSLRQVVDLHRKMTGSRRAGSLLDNWDEALGAFQRVSPYTAPEVARSVFHFDREPFIPAF